VQDQVVADGLGHDPERTVEALQVTRWHGWETPGPTDRAPPTASPPTAYKARSATARGTPCCSCCATLESRTAAVPDRTRTTSSRATVRRRLVCLLRRGYGVAGRKMRIAVPADLARYIEIQA
jgi:hypothetical protein